MLVAIKKASRAKKGIPPEKQIAIHEAEIEKQREKWFKYRKEGTTDNWADGVGLNLTRNHIIWHLMEIARIRSNGKPVQLSIFDNPLSLDDAWAAVDKEAVMRDKRIPPEVDNNLMVTHRRALYCDHPVYEN